MDGYERAQNVNTSMALNELLRLEKVETDCLRRLLREEKEHSAMYARRIATLESENERLRKGIVWAVKHCTLTRSYDGRHYVNVPLQAKSHPYDGTDAGLIEAVLRAMGEKA